MPATITAHEQNLVKVFSDEYVFDIPPFQRPYAWTTEQAGVLLDDLMDAMDRDTEAPYFLGSVVIIKNDGDVICQVVDGQQRLTTLTILLCVLRELFGDGDRARGLDVAIREAGNEFTGAKDRFRLRLRDRDRDFFEDHVQKMGSLAKFLTLDSVNFSDSQKRIFENAKYLNQKLRSLDDDWQNRFARFVIQQCYLVVVAASDVESAYRIFSVMNDRGLDLSPTDILKANIIGKMSSHVRDEYTSQWENIEEELGRDDFRDLFAHIRMIYRKDKLRVTLQREFEEHFLHDMSSEKATKFIDNMLEPYARVFETVTRASYESTVDAGKINTPLMHLGRLDNFDWIPPAMAYFLRKEGQRETLIKFIRDLERLAYGLFILRADINGRINRYVQVLRAIEQDDDLFDDKSPLQLALNEKTEIVEKLGGDIYNQPRIPRPLLLRLDSLLAEGEASYQHPIISIEHVLPQNPSNSSQWLKWFPDEDERRQWTHRLANLVLLSRRKNTRASNFEFERKKSEYFRQNGVTTFALTTNVVAELEWTPAVLERRQQELVDALTKEWRLD